MAGSTEHGTTKWLMIAQVYWSFQKQGQVQPLKFCIWCEHFSSTSKWDYDWLISHPPRSRHISRCAFCSFFFLLQEANSTEAGIKQWNVHRNASGAASEKDLFVLLGCGVPSDWMLAKLSVLWNKFPNPLGPELCTVWDGKEITFNRKLIAKI